MRPERRTLMPSQGRGAIPPFSPEEPRRRGFASAPRMDWASSEIRVFNPITWPSAGPARVAGIDERLDHRLVRDSGQRAIARPLTIPRVMAAVVEADRIVPMATTSSPTLMPDDQARAAGGSSPPPAAAPGRARVEAAAVAFVPLSSVTLSKAASATSRAFVRCLAVLATMVSTRAGSSRSAWGLALLILVRPSRPRSATRAEQDGQWLRAGLRTRPDRQQRQEQRGTD